MTQEKDEKPILPYPSSGPFNKNIPERADTLPEPFATAIKNGGTIDYMVDRVKDGQIPDHKYVYDLGYKPEQKSDLTYEAEGLEGLSLSSYGDWGTLWPCASDKAREVFFDMLDKGLISLWRIRQHKDDFEYTYSIGDGWTKYCPRNRDSVVSSSPYFEGREKTPYEKFIEMATDEEMNILFVSLISADSLVDGEEVCEKSLEILEKISRALKTAEISRERSERWLVYCEDGREIITRDLEEFKKNEGKE